MSMAEIIGSPTFILSAISSVIVFAAYIYYTKYNTQDHVDRVPVFIFDRTKHVTRQRAKTFDGLVSYGTGGFIEDHAIAVDFRSGRIRKTGRDGLKAKNRMTVYLSRIGSITALDLKTEDNRPGDFDEKHYDMLRYTTRERAVHEGKMNATRTDSIGKMLTIGAVVSAVLGGIAWLFVVIAPSIT